MAKIQNLPPLVPKHIDPQTLRLDLDRINKEKSTPPAVVIDASDRFDAETKGSAQVPLGTDSSGENRQTPSQIRAAELIAKKQAGTTEHVIHENEQHRTAEIFGVPDFVKPFEHGGMTFRRYFSTAESLAEAKASKTLTAGIVPYAQMGGGGWRTTFSDLDGVYLTLPEVAPSAVGVADYDPKNYLDFTLDKDTAVLEIEPGKIYLIPGESSTTPWLVKAYESYKAGKGVPAYMLPAMEKIDKAGGIKEPLQVKFTLADPLPEPMANRPQIAERLDDGKLQKDILAGYKLPDDYLASYFQRRIEPYLSRPSFEHKDNPTSLYRGVHLTLDELQETLREGFKLAHVSWNAGGDPGISYSTSISEAQSYVFQNGRSHIDGVGVLFEVRAVPEIGPLEVGNLNPTGTIYRAPKDVAAEEIVNVCLWGQWGWESLDSILEKAADGNITPHTDWTGIFNSGFSR